MIHPDSFPAGCLPAAPAAENRPAPNVLVVDDDPGIVGMLTVLLESAGFAVTATTDSNEALLCLTATPARFAALVSDQEMPTLNGCDLIDRARAAGFQGRVVLHSGALGGASAADRARQADAVVHKPYGARTLVPVLRRLMA